MGLFKPGWMASSFYDSNATYKIKRSIDKIKSQEKLSKIVLTAYENFACSYALKMITDQTILEELAKHPKCRVRPEVVRKLTNQSMIADFAKNHPDYYTRIAAVTALADRVILVDIARNDKEYCVRDSAIAKLLNVKIIKDEINNITDRAILEIIAKYTGADFNRRSAEIRLFRLYGVKVHDCEHEWIILDCCLKKCKKCSALAYQHVYRAFNIPIGDSDLSTGYKCEKCGHEGWGGGRGADTTQYGLIE